MNISLKYIIMLEIAGSVCEDQINTCLILVIFATCWFFNQTFKIVHSTKIFQSLITHCNIEVSHEHKLIIKLAIFITDKIKVV